MLYIARSGEGCWLALKLLGLRNNPHDEGIDLEVAQNSENFEYSLLEQGPFWLILKPVGVVLFFGMSCTRNHLHKSDEGRFYVILFRFK